MRTSAIPLVFLLLSGCVSGPVSERFWKDKKFRDTYAVEHQELSEDIRRAVLMGEIVPGMDRRTIEDLLGQPRSTFVSKTGMMQVWCYENFYVGFDKEDRVVKFGWYGKRPKESR